MDTSSILTVLVLLVAGALLVLIAGAEAGVTAISRVRIRNGHANGLANLLRNYVRQRQRILRNLSVASTAMIVTWTSALAYLLLGGTRFTASAALLVGVLAVLTVVLLRQSARTVVLLDPEAWGVRLARPIGALQALFAPLAWLANAPIRLMLRLLGDREDHEVDPAEELSGLLEIAGDDEGALAEERRMMRGILEMSDQTVREIMTPRTDLTAVPIDATVGDVMRVITESGYSRIPLYEDSLDRIVGVVYAKDLLAYLRAGDVTPTLRDIARTPYFVPETKRTNELLADLRRDQVHMAVAVDEYGGTAGIVTVEDLVEEIVGEITDEYDVSEVDVQRVSDEEAIVDARLSIDELNEIFDMEIEPEDFDTVGGLVVTRLGRLAVPGDEVVAYGGESERDRDREEGPALSLRVLSILGRRIKKVRVQRIGPAGSNADGASTPEAERERV